MIFISYFAWILAVWYNISLFIHLSIHPSIHPGEPVCSYCLQILLRIRRLSSTVQNTAFIAFFFYMIASSLSDLISPY